MRIEAKDRNGDGMIFSVNHPDFEMHGNALWLRAGRGLDFETNIAGIDLIITVTDDSPQRLSTDVPVRLVIEDRNDPTTGRTAVIGLVGDQAEANTPLRADPNGITDPDGPLQYTYAWYRGDVRLRQSRNFTPDAAGEYRLVITATDPRFATSTPFEHSFAITAPPPVNQKPSRITLDQVSVSLNEGQLPQGALSRITITDDGLGSVGLAPLPASSIFEYRAVQGERGVYDLYLKAGVVLNQALVGNHSLRIVVTGDGAGNNLLPHADFTLWVSDIEHDPVLIVTPPAKTAGDQ